MRWKHPITKRGWVQKQAVNAVEHESEDWGAKALTKVINATRVQYKGGDQIEEGEVKCKKE